MEHPLIASLDALTIDELGTKISELHKKLGIAMVGRGPAMAYAIKFVWLWKVIKASINNVCKNHTSQPTQIKPLMIRSISADATR